MHLIDYIIVWFYLLAIVLLGIFLQRKASAGIESYFLGDRNIPWWVLGASGMAGIVLIMAMFMIFMGKWNRRAQVMTLAEWMQLIVSAVSTIIFTIGAISYFAVGGGKFLGQFIGFDDRLASTLLIILALIYTAISGVYGVVLTDVFQGVLIFVAVIYICAIALQTPPLPETFAISIPGTDRLQEWNFSEGRSILPPMQVYLPGDYASFNLFGGILCFYLLKVLMEGFGGVGGYMMQRYLLFCAGSAPRRYRSYLAAKSDREAGLLSLWWIFLLSFRWPLVTTFAILGINYQILSLLLIVLSIGLYFTWYRHLGKEVPLPSNPRG